MRALIILAVLAAPALAKMRPPPEVALTPNQVTRAMRSGKPAFRACFNRALQRNPKLPGRFAYTFTIEASGKVSSAAPMAATAESAAVDTCIVAAIKKIVFPKSSSATTINYPLNSSSR